MTPIRPRVHWVSPIPHAETDIGHYTARILPELAEHCDLVLWTDALTWDRSLERYCTIRQLDPDHILPRDFAAALPGQGIDTVFVHIGNSWVFHAGFLRLVQRIPSVIVLHDLAIQELTIDAIRNNLFDRQSYEAEMRRWYGPDGLTRAQDVLDDKLPTLKIVKDMPGFETTLNRAVSVLTHTPAAFEAVQARAAVPAYRLDLPFRPSAAAPTAARARQGPLKFAQFGYIGPNRRLMQVLDVLGALAGEIDFQFDIMGNVWDPSRVTRHIKALGLQDRVTLHGFVAERELDARLRAAHLIFNLRHPTMGEASGTQLRVWNAAAACVVTDAGWYGSLPEDAVFKIPLADEAQALTRLLRAIAADPAIVEPVGAAGRAQLEARHTPARYAQSIAYVARRFGEDAGASVLGQAGRRALATMAGSDPLLAAALEPRL